MLLLASLFLWSLAYQQKQSYTVDVGGLGDNAYVTGFQGKERNADLDYRWSLASASVTFPGIGNEPVVLSLRTIGYRPDGNPPILTVRARGKIYSVQTTSSLHTDAIALERGDALNGNLVITLESPTFTLPTDQREHGVIIDSISVSPIDYGLRPIVVPPLDALLAMLVGVAAIYMLVMLTLRRRRFALIAGCALSVIFSLLTLLARPELGLLVPQLPWLSLWALLLGIGGRLVLDRLVVPQSAAAFFASGVGSLAFALAFVVRFGGLTYPQFLTSDLDFHVHRMQRVLDGWWVFTSNLPDGTVVPYPPALYVVLAPLNLLFGRSDDTVALMLKASTALLDAATCLALAWAGWRLWRGRAGGIAAVAYALILAPFELFSAGNYTNLFGQGVLNLTLLGSVVYLNGRDVFRAPLWVGILSVGFVLTMLGHYGIMLSTPLILGVFGAWTLVETLRGGRPRRSWYLLFGYIISLIASFAFYYRFFLSEMWEQFSALAARFTSRSQSISAGDGAIPVAVTPFYEKLTSKIASLVGLPLSISALIGFVLPRTSDLRLTVEVDRQARALMLCWVGVAAFFLLLDQALGDAIRWYYLAAALLALVGGRFLERLGMKGRVAPLLVGLILSVMLLQLLNSWVGDQIFTRYHDK